MRGNLFGVINRQAFHRPSCPPKIIDELVTCYRINPGRKRLGRIVSMPPYMNRQQRLLNEILDIGRTLSRQPSSVISAQVPAQPAKNIAVRGFVASEGRLHQTLQFSLNSVHPGACLYIRDAFRTKRGETSQRGRGTIGDSALSPTTPRQQRARRDRAATTGKPVLRRLRKLFEGSRTGRSCSGLPRPGSDP